MPNDIKKLDDGIRQCTKCLEIKPIASFYLTTDARTGKPYRYTRCNVCSREMAREWQRRYPERANLQARRWRENNPDKAKEVSAKSAKKWYSKPENRLKKNAILRRHHLKKNYGLTEQQRDALLEKQNGLCACCGESAKRLVVDHCHSTGKVRGLLCDFCNHLIGMLESREDSLRKCEAFLTRCKENS